MGWAQDRPALVAQREPQASQLERRELPVSLELRRVQWARALTVFRLQLSDRIELSRRQRPSRPPESRADPPSVSAHLPAAAKGAIWFRPA